MSTRYSTVKRKDTKTVHLMREDTHGMAALCGFAPPWWQVFNGSICEATYCRNCIRVARKELAELESWVQVMEGADAQEAAK